MPIIMLFEAQHTYLSNCKNLHQISSLWIHTNTIYIISSFYPFHTYYPQKPHDQVSLHLYTTASKHICSKKAIMYLNIIIRERHLSKPVEKLPFTKYTLNFGVNFVFLASTTTDRSAVDDESQSENKHNMICQL